MGKKRRLRPLGQITGEMELLLQEMTDEGPSGHGLQRHEIVAIVCEWINFHAEHALERLEEDGRVPVLKWE